MRYFIVGFLIRDKNGVDGSGTTIVCSEDFPSRESLYGVIMTKRNASWLSIVSISEIPEADIQGKWDDGSDDIEPIPETMLTATPYNFMEHLQSLGYSVDQDYSEGLVLRFSLTKERGLRAFFTNIHPSKMCKFTLFAEAQVTDMSSDLLYYRDIGDRDYYTLLSFSFLPTIANASTIEYMIKEAEAIFYDNFPVEIRL